MHWRGRSHECGSTNAYKETGRDVDPLDDLTSNACALRDGRDRLEARMS